MELKGYRMTTPAKTSGKTSRRLDATFAALADPTRRAILARLALGEASVNELAEPFNISQPAISKHLKVLENAGLVPLDFTVYATGSSDTVLRGGRYDEVGAVFGRNRPAVGFSLDVKGLAALAPGKGLNAAIRAPWAEDPALRVAVRRLREGGDTVVCILPGHEHEGQEFACDRELVVQGGQWAVRSL